jgi:hypothetical protein
MNNQGGAGGQDYGDKIFQGAAKKFGGAQGQKIAGNKAMSEKVVSITPLDMRNGTHNNIVADLLRLDRWPPQNLREGYWKESEHSHDPKQPF